MNVFWLINSLGEAKLNHKEELMETRVKKEDDNLRLRVFSRQPPAARQQIQTKKENVSSSFQCQQRIGSEFLLSTTVFNLLFKTQLNSI